MRVFLVLYFSQIVQCFPTKDSYEEVGNDLYSVKKNVQVNHFNKDPIDLSWEVNEETKSWFDKIEHKFRYVARFESDLQNFTNNSIQWISRKSFCIAEHAGTHLDAPYHFNKDGWKLAEIPINRLIVNGSAIHLTELIKSNGTNATLRVYHLVDWIKRNGNFKPNSVLLVNFGWSKKYSQGRDTYFGIDYEGNYNFPSVSEEAAMWLANNINIVGVGVDTPSVDPGNVKSFIAHRLLAAKFKYNLENVRIPSYLPETGFKLVIMPIKTSTGTGGAVRITALPVRI